MRHIPGYSSELVSNQQRKLTGWPKCSERGNRFQGYKLLTVTRWKCLTEFSYCKTNLERLKVCFSFNFIFSLFLISRILLRFLLCGQFHADVLKEDTETQNLQGQVKSSSSIKRPALRCSSLVNCVAIRLWSVNRRREVKWQNRVQGLGDETHSPKQERVAKFHHLRNSSKSESFCQRTPWSSVPSFFAADG